MGAGFHGGFGNTAGRKEMGAIAADSKLIGNGKGNLLSSYADKVEKEPGYTDVAVHGTPDHVTVYRKQGNKEQKIILDQRRLASFLKKDKGYNGSKIRLLSCKTGSETGKFAQNLANKLGVVVRAPSDTLYIYPNGKMVIGPDAFTNSGRWIDYYPYKRKRGKL